MRVAVVGAGIAGLACARELVTSGVAVTVIDRGRAVGGRMASRRLDGRPIDLGASYLTVSDDAFGAVVADWCGRGLARPWTDSFAVAGAGPTRWPLRYGASGGLRRLTEDLAEGLDVVGGTTVTTVRRVGGRLEVDGEAYDAVVLAMPDPQAHRLLDEGRRATLPPAAAFDPVIALAARFADRPWDEDGMFVNDDPVLAWIADDGRRRGDDAPVLVAHSTAGLAARFLDDPSAAEPEMTAALAAIVGATPTSTYVHRWTFAKPAGGRDEPYALVDGLGLCGDGWSSKPRVEAAWLSGRDLARALL